MPENVIHPDAYPLSKSQMNIWHLEQSFCGTSMNNICETIRICGVFDLVLLQDCLNRIVQADSSLRTRIYIDGQGVPMQYEVPFSRCQFPLFDFSATNAGGLQHWEQSVTREVMPVLESPLYYFAVLRIGEHEGGVLIKTHHLISDGWSQVSLINRVAKTYMELLQGGEAAVTLTPGCSYRTHVQQEEKYLASKAYERDKEYWRQNLKDIAPPVSLKDFSEARLSPIGQRATFYLSQTLNHLLSSFCTAHRVAPFAVFYMALAIYLKRIKNAGQVCIGAPIHNRANLTDRQTTGMFVSTLPFLSHIDENWSFEQLSDKLADNWLDLLRHQKCPFPDILAAARESAPQIDRLFELVLSFHNSQAYHCKDASIAFSGQWHYAGYQAEHLCIHLNNIEDERRYSVNYDYLTQLFSRREIEDLHSYLVHLLTQALQNPQLPIYRLSLIKEEEQEKVLFTFNRAQSYIGEENLCEKLEQVQRMFPTRAAVIYNQKRYTYQALWEQSAGIASRLLQMYPKGQQTIAILLPKSFALLRAMVGVLRSGNAWVLLSSQLPPKRLEEILADSGAAVLLSGSALVNRFFPGGAPVPFIDGENDAPIVGGLTACPAKATDLAYVVYTSGSTGAPKGVEIEQRSLLNFAKASAQFFSKGAVLSLCNISFDAFLLESIIALLNAQTVVLPTPEQQENPAKIAALICSYAVGFVALTPSRLSAYLKDSSFYKASARLETVVCGGEAFPAPLLKTLSRCTQARIYNQYGPSETTVGVTTALLNTASRITVGAPMCNCRCYVLDSHLQPLPIGVAGDLYIGGLCVGRGYRGAPTLTEKAFLPSPFEPDERLYRTGDIAAWTPEGELLIKGRQDGQIKLRGQRIELSEISQRICMHPAVRQAVAVLKNSGGSDIIVAYYAARTPVTQGELLEFCATYLPGYMVPSLFCSVPEIPLSQNGKVDEARLPAPVMTLDAGQSTSACGQQILRIFEKILHRSDMRAGDDYFLCGGDSLNALEALSALEEAFGVRLRVADLYACRTAARLESLLQQSTGDTGTPVIGKAPLQPSYPLTPAQLGIYFDTQLTPDATIYNMPCAWRMQGKLDSDRLEQALQVLVKQEPLLRTAFLPGQNGICQKVLDTVPVCLQTYRDIPLKSAMDAFVQPFDLTCTQSALVRLGYWEDETDCVVLMDMHHIAGDGVSALLLLQRLNDLYSGKAVTVPRISFLDYAWWLQQNEPALLQAQEPYWRSALENAPQPPEIPTDFPRQKQFDHKGDDLAFTLSKEESEALDAYCAKCGLTPNMLFTGAFGLLVHQLSGADDLLIGTPVANRRQREIENTVGLFIGTLPLRLRFNEQSTVSEYLQQVRTAGMEMLDYPDVSVNRLGELCGRKQTPLYNVMLSMRPVSTDPLTFAGIPVQAEFLPAKSAKMDLNVEISRSGGCYGVSLQYASALFMRQTVELYARSLQTLVRNMTADDTQPLCRCSALSALDRYRLVEQPRALRMPFSDIPVHKQIEAMAQIQPDAPALIFHDEVYTFRRMMQDADALAAALVQQGVKPGDRVGILCRRGPQVLISMLAALKVGATYVPMLPTFPQNRLEYMVQISAVTLILCDTATFAQKPSLSGSVLLEIEACIDWRLPFAPLTPTPQNEICCILFTSGSTGQPKGVMIRHRSICNLMAVLYGKLQSARGGYLCTATSIFDIFITETLLAMAFGNYCVMADEQQSVLPWQAAMLVKKHHVQLIEFTPSRAQLFLDNKDFYNAITGMPVAMMCGEVLPPQLLQKLRDAHCGTIYNLYGPTETTVYCTMDDVTTAQKITVGPLYPNCRGYVLDENRQPVLPTAAGELYFAGECIAAGYVGREDLTEQLFVPDPFFPGEKMYRSGDIVRQLADGRLDFIGRRDHQVKLNGQRIELAEITQKMLDSGMVARAATTIKKENGYMTLRGFVQPKEGTVPEIARLRAYLNKELPAYMVPSEIFVLDALPCTASGKTDLKALEAYTPGVPSQPDLPASSTNAAPAPNSPVAGEAMPAAPATDAAAESPAAASTATPVIAAPMANQTAFATFAPATDAADLTRMWAELLPENKVDPAVSFFEQGGNSMAALNLLSRYYDAGLSMTLAQFYEMPSLAEHLRFFGLDSSGPAADTVQQPAVKSEPTVQSAAPLPQHSDLPQKLTQIWQETLHTDAISPDISFFEQGGNSMAALLVLSKYYDLGLSMTLSDFYEQPVLARQLQQLAAADAAQSGTAQKSGRQGALITGATGFYGAHMVKELCENGVQPVYCVVRGNENRLFETLNWYFGQQWTQNHRTQLVSLCGDVLQPDFGLTPQTLAEIEKEAAFLLHAAADTRHYASDDAPVRTNVQGTQNAIALAQQRKLKLCYVSTVSLCGEYLPASPQIRREFTEQDFEIGQNWRDSVYLRGKYQSEQLVHAAMQQGLPACILRLGRLVGRSSDGVFQKDGQNNTFRQIVDGAACLRKISAELLEQRIELSAIDECTAACTLLMLHGENTVYHVCNPQVLTARQILGSLQLNPLPVSRTEFEAHLRELLHSPARMRLAPLLAQYMRTLQIPPRIEVSCAYTQKVLQGLHFTWQKPDPAILLRSFIRSSQ